MNNNNNNNNMNNNGGGGNNSNNNNSINPSRKWYLFVYSILLDGFDKFQKSARLHLLHAYI
jgi:hypothetical protein